MSSLQQRTTVLWKDECENRVSNQWCFPRISFTLSALCSFLSQSQCIVFNRFWWIYWPWNFLMVLQTHAVSVSWMCCTKEIQTLQSHKEPPPLIHPEPAVLPSLSSAVPGSYPGRKREGWISPNWCDPVGSCHPSLSRLTPRLQEPSLCDHPEATQVCGLLSHQPGQQVWDWE